MGGQPFQTTSLNHVMVLTEQVYSTWPLLFDDGTTVGLLFENGVPAVACCLRGSRSSLLKEILNMPAREFQLKGLMD